MKKEYLFTPGPTPIPPESSLVMSRQIGYHRSPEATQIIRESSQMLKHVFQTQNEVMILTSSGTGAMEAAVCNLLSPNDKVLVIRAGKFGERWAEICAAYGVEFDPIDVQWGLSVEPELVEKRLKSNPEIKAVFATLCETSTGGLHDIKALGQIVKETPALLIVDAVSGLAADELPMDNWHVDGVVSCSQKGLMTPPGLGFIAFGEKAWRLAETSKLPKYYFDLKKAKAGVEKGQTPYTPAISLIVGLHQALKLICEEGIRRVLARHTRLAEATRSGIKAMGLELFASLPANTLTSVRVPEGVDGRLLLKQVKEKQGVIFAGGQDKISGKIFRIAHLGYCSDLDVIIAISAVEFGLAQIGFQFKLGSGVGAAEEVLSKMIANSQ
jgi:aspartate aminotransferase-like enzyme